MRTFMAVLLLLTASMAQAREGDEFDDIVEMSPGLYLLLYQARLEPYVSLRLDAIRHANAFAASRGGVVVPVTGRFGERGLTLRVFEYQFRVMSHADAVAARPVMADAVIAVHSVGQCAPPAAGVNEAAVAAAMQAPAGVRIVRGPGLLWRLPDLQDDDAAPQGQDSPGALCLPGQICQPAQLCLPGWQCSPGMPPMPEATPPAAPPPAGSTGQ